MDFFPLYFTKKFMWGKCLWRRGKIIIDPYRLFLDQDNALRCPSPPPFTLFPTQALLFLAIRGRCCRRRPAAELPERSLGGGLSERACPGLVWVRTFLGASSWLEFHSAASAWSRGCLLAHCTQTETTVNGFFFLIIIACCERAWYRWSESNIRDWNEKDQDRCSWLDIRSAAGKAGIKPYRLPSELFKIGFRNEHLGVS